MIDTGSQCTILKESYGKSIGAKFLPLKAEHPRKLIVANGRVLNVHNYVELVLTIENVDFVCEALVANELSVNAELVIGVQFMKEHKAVIDFNHNILSLDDSLLTEFAVISDEHDILSLTDLTKLRPHSMTSVRVKVPVRFNGKLIQVTPLKSIKNDEIILEQSVNKPIQGNTYVMLSNLTDKTIHLPKFMKVAACEIISTDQIMAISDLTPDKPPQFVQQTDDDNIIDFHDESESIRQHLPRYRGASKSNCPLNANAPPFEPRGNKCPATNDDGIQLITEADKLKSLEKFGLNLDGCKITPEQKSILIDVLFQYREVFNTESPPLNPIPGFKYSIPLIDNEPVFTRQYRMRLDVNSLLQEHVEKLLKDGILERSFSRYNSPVLLVKKSQNMKQSDDPNKAATFSTTRLVLDCRQINKKIKPSFNFLHDLDYVIQRVQSFRGKFFSTLDIKNAFYAIELDENSRDLTSFTIQGGGSAYRFKRMVQGMMTSPSVWCQIINTIFNEKEYNLAIYVDDLILANKTFEEHLENLKSVLKRSLENNLRINGIKCKFFAERVPFLGKILSAEGCHADEGRLKALLTLEPPNNVHELRKLIGSFSFFRKHIEGYSHMIAPFTRLLRKNSKFVFDSACMNAFNRLKEAFKSPAILRNFTPGKPVYLYVDASLTSIASALYQKDDNTGKLHLIDTAGRQLSIFETKYTIVELEMLSLVYSLSAYRQYISVSTEIIVKSDNISLSYWRSIKQHPMGRLNRWAQILGQYFITLTHLTTKENSFVDMLSRREYTKDSETLVDEEQINETVLAIEPVQTYNQPDSQITVNVEPTHFPYNDIQPELKHSHSSISSSENTAHFKENDTPVLSFEETFKLARSIVSLDSISKNAPRFSDAIINNAEFRLRSVIDDSTSGKYSTADRPVLTRPDFDLACQNLMTPTYVGDYLDDKLSHDISLYTIETDQTNIGHVKVVGDTARTPGGSTDREIFAIGSPDNDKRLTGHVNQLTTDCLTTDTDIHFTETTDSTFVMDEPERTDINSKHMFEAQRTDADLSAMIAYLERNELPADAHTARIITAEADQYFIDTENKLLYHIQQKRAKKPVLPHNFTRQLVIPEKLIPELFQMSHDSAFGAHFSTDYLYSRLSSWCFFQKMYSRIESYVKYCSQCQLGKAGLKPKHPLLTNTEEVDAPFKAYTFDFLKLPLLKNGFNYVLLFVDKYSHMTHAFATKDQSAEIVAYHLYNDIISQYGVMEKLFSDRAAAFTGKIMTSLTETYGIKHVISSSRHAQTQGLVERAYKQLVNILRTIGDSASQWNKYLGAINLAMRCVPSKALCGFTSAEAAFGRRLKTPEESLMAPKTSSGFKNIDDFITDLKEKISLIQSIV